jgi:hypothetical protein
MKPTDSPFWKGLMKVKEEFFNMGSFMVGNSEDTRFWEDVWLGNLSLAEQYLISTILCKENKCL